MSIASLWFGLSKSLAGVILARCFGSSSLRCSARDQNGLTHHKLLHRSWSRFWQCRRHLLRLGRTDRLDEPSHRISHLRPHMALWRNHRVRRIYISDSVVISRLSLVLCLDRCWVELCQTLRPSFRAWRITSFSARIPISYPAWSRPLYL